MARVNARALGRATRGASRQRNRLAANLYRKRPNGFQDDWNTLRSGRRRRR